MPTDQDQPRRDARRRTGSHRDLVTAVEKTQRVDNEDTRETPDGVYKVTYSNTDFESAMKAHCATEAIEGYWEFRRKYNSCRLDVDEILELSNLDL